VKFQVRVSSHSPLNGTAEASRLAAQRAPSERGRIVLSLERNPWANASAACVLDVAEAVVKYGRVPLTEILHYADFVAVDVILAIQCVAPIG
jgi:hypothetical protein